jgi:hypothetical protein
MSNLKPHRRVVIGRNITLTAGACLALTRGMTYATLDPANMNLGQQLVTLDGKILGVWAGVWLAAAVLCIADMVNRHTRYGLSLLVGAAFAWGIGYLIAWALTGFTNPSLITSAMIWIMPAALIFGFLLKVTALQDMLRQKTSPGGQRE